MAPPTRRDARRALHQLADRQGGYFTSKQAARLGYAQPHLAYHVAARNFVHVGHGLYRLPAIPSSEHDQLIRLSLWSRDRRGRSQAVVSHATALFLHGLSDVLPSRVHLSVPLSFRKPAPRGCVLHRASHARGDVEAWDAFSVTTPLRTLLDVAREGSVSREQVGRALADAERRGLVRRSVLRASLRDLLGPTTARSLLATG